MAETCSDTLVEQIPAEEPVNITLELLPGLLEFNRSPNVSRECLDRRRLHKQYPPKLENNLNRR